MVNYIVNFLEYVDANSQRLNKKLTSIKQSKYLQLLKNWIAINKSFTLLSCILQKVTLQCSNFQNP